ncbi:aminoglycoside phosphotransferase family protein [Qipengyuania thermophila]|uniref:aminoglycoside phosphotransferase family protein n=1 Tax=Qipengyuania thermophila TaxID=2509361 RepID=UPI0036F1C565
MSALDPVMDAFLAGAGWADAEAEPLSGDASFRRYFRVRGGQGTAMLMHAPPPQEDIAPFVHVGTWLCAQGLRAPRILAQDPLHGFLLLEDFGDIRLKEHVEQEGPDAERAAYAQAVDTLVRLQNCGPGPFASYDGDVLMREVDLFLAWYCRNAHHLDTSGWTASWSRVLEPILAPSAHRVTVLRDYHAENIMVLPDGSQGLIDFQDALAGHPAYDLVSLLQDARRDVEPELEEAMIARFMDATGQDDGFRAAYAVLGAQRNAKIIGIFSRLARRDAKPRYLDLIPRVGALLARDLAHPALEPVAEWMARNLDAAFPTGGA